MTVEERVWAAESAIKMVRRLREELPPWPEREELGHVKDVLEALRWRLQRELNGEDL